MLMLVAGSLLVLLAFTGLHAIFIAKTFLRQKRFHHFETFFVFLTWRLLAWE